MIDLNFDAWGNAKNAGSDFGIFGNEAHRQIGGDTPSTSSGFDWKGFGKSMNGIVNNNLSSNNRPRQVFSFNPTMAQPGYVQNQFATNPYNPRMLNQNYNNLFDYLMR